MIIKVIKRNPLGMKQEVNMLSALFGKERVELMPEEMEIWIDTERIEMMVPPVGKEPDGGCFSIKYAGDIIFIKDNCYEELLGAWEKSKKSNEETDEKYNELLRQYQEIIELEKENKKSCQCESDNKGTADPELPTAKRMGDNRPVTERIRTMMDVLDELGTDHPLVVQYVNITERGQQDEYLATFMQLRMLCEALNEGWHPTFEPGEYRYWPWFWLYRSKEDAERLKSDEEEIFEVPSAVRACLWGGGAGSGANDGFAYAYSGAAPSSAGAYVSSRLCLKSRELALHAARHFHDLWLKFYCM